jgi:nucleoside-diphosphate-sugar epimerase
LTLDSPPSAIVAVRPRLVWGRDDTTALPQLAAAARRKKLVWIGGERYRTATMLSARLQRAGAAVPEKSAPHRLAASLATLGDGLVRLSGGRLRGSISRQEYGTVGVEVTLDIAKARRELGHAPVITREKGVGDGRAVVMTGSQDGDAGSTVFRDKTIMYACGYTAANAA